MALVFTDCCLRTERKRCEKRPCSDWSPLQVVALSPHHESLRAAIETWVVRMPPSERQKVIRRLQSSKNFVSTLNELIVGNKLKDLGYALEYEKELDGGLTPDWYVLRKAEVPPFVVEVFTRHISPTQARLESGISDLYRRLAEIPVGVVLDLDLEEDSMALDHGFNKKISKEVEKWLLSGEPPPVGATLPKEGMTEWMPIEIVYYDQKLRSVQPMGLVVTSWVNITGLRRKIKTKIRKYEQSLGEMGVPFVIAVAAHFNTGVVIRRFEEELFRQGGLFEEKKALSWAIWLDVSDPQACRLRHFPNPLAVNPLPEETFLEEGETSYGL